MYIVRFGSMRKTYRAAEWALEAKKTKTAIWWNVWVLLAMPVALPTLVLLSSGTAGDQDNAFRYGGAMDRAWKARIGGWLEETALSPPAPPYSAQHAYYTPCTTLDSTISTLTGVNWSTPLSTYSGGIFKPWAVTLTPWPEPLPLPQEDATRIEPSYAPPHKEHNNNVAEGSRSSTPDTPADEPTIRRNSPGWGFSPDPSLHGELPASPPRSAKANLNTMLLIPAL
ncbi:hypothetical protein CPB83DRAFT_836744 [Crepidotus variabilis]|uniref:Transmembrane protein n=1 Tax=Crepidotus variabilis TaxID=179855 RepID=A0A9P6JNQ8_9AGAR|nr:hypothetical protein CPB83DRAFT_836744 [Crepidotus variabilis]